ncbi:MAG: glycosyltransferase family 39 protein [bacterium]
MAPHEDKSSDEVQDSPKLVEVAEMIAVKNTVEKISTTPEKAGFWKKIPLALISITLLGLIIRLLLITVEKQVYVDGVHYLLQGENIRNGVWDTWDPNGGRWMVPPLLPMLVSIMLNYVNNTELASRLGSVIVSISVIPGLYLIARKFAGEKCGRWAAFIAAVDPLLAHYSIVTYAEPLFFTMLIWTVWFSIKTIGSEKKLIPAFFMGLFAALAYLAKAFGLVVWVWGLVILLYYTISAKERSKVKYRPIFAYIVGSLVLAIPYMIFLYSYLGYFAPDGKSQFQFTRLYAPTLEQERIDPRYEGIITDDYEYALLSGEPQFGKLSGIEFARNYAKKYVRKLIEIFIDYPIKQVPPFSNVRLTTPLFLMLLGLGLFSIPLTLSKSPAQRILLSWLFLWLFIAPLNFIEVRYFVPIVPLLIPFVAQGASRLEDWIKHTSLFKREKHRIMVVPLTGLIIVAFSLPSITYKFTHQDDPDVFYNEWERSGEFLRNYDPGDDKQIVECRHMTGYYAGMQSWVTPDTDYNGLVRFMLKHDIKYFSVDSFLSPQKNHRPYLEVYFRDPYQDTYEFKMIYNDDNYDGHHVVIYELKDRIIKNWKDSQALNKPTV